jgi:uncharacterized protein YjbI with pentapeptide repeats
MSKDFHRQNLRGLSFKRQDLRGADFSYADIRGSDFTQAILVGANFSHTKAGLKVGWFLALRVVLLFIATLAGFISAYAGAFVGGAVVLDLFVASFTLILFLGFVSITILKGISTALWLFAVTVVTSITIFLALPGTDDSRASAVLLAIVITVNISGVLVGAIAVAVSRILCKTWMLVILGFATLAAAVLGTLAGSEEIIGIPAKFVKVLAIAIPVTGALVSLSLYIGWRAIAGDKKYALVRRIAIVLCTYGGTSFRRADLTDADFSYATLKNTDFREANLTRTCWFQAQYVEQSRAKGTYLEHSQVRQLAVTKNGQEQNFAHLDLRGLNLQGANLVKVSLIGAKLSEATLYKADLSEAKLAQCQLYGADLMGANLTGAIIENWGISTDTKLEQVRCDYIYMRLPTPSDLDPWRKPDNRKENFKEGDFADFIAPIIKTLTLYKLQNVDTRAIKFLDLYHYDGIDPSAAAIALKQLAEHLAEEYPEADLEVVALEGRGDEKVRLQAKVTGFDDLSALSAEYSARYQELKSLPYKDLQSLLIAMVEKDKQIRSLQMMVMTAIKSDKYYIQRSININSGIYAENYQNQGDTMSDKSQNSNYDLRNAKMGAFAGTGGQASGTFNDYSSSQNLSQAAAEIQQLLRQLEAANPTTTLSDKMTIVAKAVNEIEKNPSLKAQVVAALNAVSSEALKKAIDHPLAKNLMPIVEEWAEEGE